MSWSAISAFEWDKEEWYKRYILGEKTDPSKEMIFGSMIGKKIEKDPAFMPELPRFASMEFPFNVVFNGIRLVGYADSFCNVTFRKLLEIKTGKKAWTQKRADEHGQITLYCMFNYIKNKITPENMEIILAWLPTAETATYEIEFVKNMKPVLLQTKRTTADILEMGSRINRTIKEMEAYVQNHA